jgi:hypothetical protein
LAKALSFIVCFFDVVSERNKKLMGMFLRMALVIEY